MLKTICVFGFLILAFPFSCLYAEDGKLEEIRKETKTSSDRSRSESKSSSSNSSDDDDDSDFSSIFGELFGGIILYTIISPYYLPYKVFDDGYDSPLYFHPYPYCANEKGYMTDISDLKVTAFDLSGEYKIYKDDVYGIGLHFKARTSFRFEVHADYTFLEEKLSNGTTDSLNLGNVNVLYRFAQNNYLLMHSGVGLNILHDKEDKYGFNYNYSLEIYPIKPMYFSIGLDWGRLGSSNVVRFRAMMGVCYQAFELDVGFESYKIGDVNLEGVVFGFKVYF